MVQFLDTQASQAPTPVHPYKWGGSLNFGLPTIQASKRSFWVLCVPVQMY